MTQWLRRRLVSKQVSHSLVVLLDFDALGSEVDMTLQAPKHIRDALSSVVGRRAACGRSPS